MRLGINAMRLSGQRLGVGRYIEYMLRYWERFLQPSDSVTIYVREPFDKRTLNLSDAYTVKLLESSLGGVLWEHLALAPRHREMDVLFCPSYTMPLHYRGRCVVATHSVNEVQLGAHPWWYNLTYSQRNRLSARRADRVIVPSESTRHHVERIYGVAPGKIDLVVEGVPETFHPLKDSAQLQAVRRKYLGDDRPYVAFVGKLSQRRNIPALIEAFAMLKRRDNIPHSLLLFGPNILGLRLNELTDRFGVTGSVVQNDGILEKHDDIVPVFCAADLFVHPSAYEGFSITTVEAMACGVPVITVNRGAAKEITDGDAAIRVDEPAAASIAAAMRRGLFDQGLRASVRANALERVRAYSYVETARQTLDVCRRAAHV